MGAFALEREYVLPEIVGQLDDRKGRARWHYGLYIHTYRHALDSTNTVLPASVHCALEILRAQIPSETR